ncbi:uncharacterized protein METZ01_LOCUS65345 [marine metagenome]|uniref:Uncharacterized protein n=1 Tax=marine metagenome TaxID=408172 RepID=A0A381TAD8_9ZZZZ
MLSSLPAELENIITNYTSQLEHVEKFQESLNIINNIYYVYYENEEGLQLSRRQIPRFFSNESVEYYHQLSSRGVDGSDVGYHFLSIEHHFDSTKTLYPTIHLSRAHYESKYRLEDCGTVYV